VSSERFHFSGKRLRDPYVYINLEVAIGSMGRFAFKFGSGRIGLIWFSKIVRLWVWLSRVGSSIRSSSVSHLVWRHFRFWVISGRSGRNINLVIDINCDICISTPILSILLYKTTKNWTGPFFIIFFKFFISQNTPHLMIYINFD
jgi:hypothetical protein